MFKFLLIKALPKVWTEAFLRMEKQDIITKALEKCFEQELIRRTWKSFVQSVIKFLEDAVEECNAAMLWSDND